MILDRILGFKKEQVSLADTLQVGGRSVPLLFVQHPRARRYLLRLRTDGVARVTVPRRGNIAAARDFAIRNLGWLEQQFLQLASQPPFRTKWNIGTLIYFRGELAPLEAAGTGLIRLGLEQIKIAHATDDLRPAIEKHLRQLATCELQARTAELAGQYGIAVARVSVRNQKSRWGSCSRQGTISLNWRLIQTPVFVRDYIILHELAHRRQMNHSNKFWREVERLCPDYLTAERWLKQHAKSLR